VISHAQKIVTCDFKIPNPGFLRSSSQGDISDCGGVQVKVINIVSGAFGRQNFFRIFCNLAENR
jgi:hypothetical protein